jgi:hypothetical protein
MPDPLIDLTIESWETLIRTLDDLNGRMPDAWFRGQEDHAWRLRPSINRYLTDVPPQQAAEMELNSLLRFMGEAHAHLPTTALPRDPFGWDVLDNYVEWLALMQHHGAPTRMLDWSCSPYVGLYFAVTGRPDTDAALWFFDHRAVSVALFERLQLPVTSLIDYRVMPSTVIAAPSTTAPIVFPAMKKMRSAREIAQQGVFTFCDHLQGDHQDALASMSGGGFGRIRIPAALKRECALRLRSMNLTPAALFPGVDGVCQSIRQDFDNYRVVPT